MKKLLSALLVLTVLAPAAPSFSGIFDFDSSIQVPKKFHYHKKKTPPPVLSSSHGGDGSENLVMGNPSNATSDSGNTDNYLMIKPQYALSYNNDTGEPNWVSWHLNASWVGKSARANDFRPDTSLPSNFVEVTPKDYTGIGFDKGHMCNSKDRTCDEGSDQATFFMDNMVPQSPNNNEHTWEGLEKYCRTLAGQGDELYIVSGPAGKGGEGRNGFVSTFPIMRNGREVGRVTVPAFTWKVVLALPAGETSPKDVTTSATVIAVIVPNKQDIDLDWRTYVVSISDVEKLTHYNFFSNVKPRVAEALKKQVYRQ